MILTGLPDVRMLVENDVRLLGAVSLTISLG